MYTDKNGDTWYKGNLHTHSTKSDGKYTPEQIFELYSNNSYDFIALTDHWVESSSEIQKNGLVCLTGCEYNVGDDPRDGIFHIVGIGMKQKTVLRPHMAQMTPQFVIDEIKSHDGIAILAHPAWSMNTWDQIEALHGLDGVEIYNTTSGTPWNCRPYSGIVIDQLALHNKMIPCMAADDVHHYNGDECRSFIYVRAEECSRDALLASIKRGDFYATQGPKLQWTIHDGELILHTSPIVQAVFYDNLIWNANRTRTGDGITEIHYPIQPAQTFIRIEVTDERGNTAWSSPIPVR